MRFIRNSQGIVRQFLGGCNDDDDADGVVEDDHDDDGEDDKV